LIASIYRLWLKLNDNTPTENGVCVNCSGQIHFTSYNTYTCNRCHEHGGMVDYCIKQMKAKNLEEAYKILEAEYEPATYFTALEQAKRIFPNIVNVYGGDKLLLEPPEGFSAPAGGCWQCGGKHFVYILRSQGTSGARCLRCGRPYPHLPKEGSIQKNSNRGNQNQQSNWRRDIKERYGGICALCGSEDNVEAHHILPVSVDPEYSLSLNNGILLCKKHHDMIHTKPVYVHNGGSPWSTK